jgi:hypothetical protein
VGGLNTTWLPLLFIELAIITPLLFFLQQKRVLLIYVVSSLLFTNWITFLYHFPYSYYRWVMWIPWSLIFLIGVALATKERVAYYLLALLGSSGIFGISYWILSSHQSLVFYDNKYPPNLYYLSYGLVGTCLLVLLAKIAEKIQSIKRISLYISSISYSLFFVHFIILDLVEQIKIKNTLLETIIVCLLSVVLLFVIKKSNQIRRNMVPMK